MMRVHYQLATLKKGSETNAEYYQHAKLLRDTLATSGKTLSSIEFTTFLLVGLGTNYDSVVTSIITRVDPLTSTQVYSHLLTHESRLALQHSNLTTSVELTANSTSKQSFNNNNRGKGSVRGRGNRGCGRGRTGGRTLSFFPLTWTHSSHLLQPLQSKLSISSTAIYFCSLYLCSRSIT